MSRKAKRVDPAEPKYPIKITSHQRDALISCTRLKGAIKDRLKTFPEGTQVVEFTRKELNQMHDEIGEAAVYAQSKEKKRLIAVQKKVLDYFEEESLIRFGVKPPTRKHRPARKSDLLFQFQITLLGTTPPIWRRIQMKDGTLGELHECVQLAMGWENCHMHQFIIDGVRYGTPTPEDFDFGLEIEDEDEVLLSELMPKAWKPCRFKYEYDFGDHWEHEILFEGYPPIEKKSRYPVCLEGERACPPEDVGGVCGFERFLTARNDRNDQDYELYADWGAAFDPDSFDPNEATQAMRWGLPDWREYR